jgi:hypothetical protein
MRVGSLLIADLDTIMRAVHDFPSLHSIDQPQHDPSEEYVQVFQQTSNILIMSITSPALMSS